MAVIATAGVRITAVVDELADRTRAGEALAGAVLLGATTSLSGSVLSVTAAWKGHADLALSNALGGIAVETAVVMLLYIDAEVRKANPSDRSQLFAAVSKGAAMRVRPKLMTVTTIFAGLAPIFITEGLGSDVMRRIALPMLGGMTSTLLLTLIVIPVPEPDPTVL